MNLDLARVIGAGCATMLMKKALSRPATASVAELLPMQVQRQQQRRIQSKSIC